MSEETPKTRKRQVVNVLSNELQRVNAAGHAGDRLWDRQLTVLHLVRAVATPGNGMSGTQAVSQIWLRPKAQEPSDTDRSTGYVLAVDANGLEIQLEDRDHVTKTVKPSTVLYAPWANVAGVVAR